jgi:hypothetical protein
MQCPSLYIAQKILYACFGLKMDKEDSVPQEEISDSKTESHTKTEESPPQKEEPAPPKSAAPAAKPEKTVERLSLTSITSLYTSRHDHLNENHTHKKKHGRTLVPYKYNITIYVT